MKDNWLRRALEDSSRRAEQLPQWKRDLVGSKEAARAEGAKGAEGARSKAKDPHDKA